MSSARITDVSVLDDFKTTLIKFNEEADNALGAAEMEVRRLLNTLEHELPMVWRRQVNERRNEIAIAKADLSRRRMQRTDGYIPDTQEQEKAVRRATARVAEAEDKIEKCKRWVLLIGRAWDDYQGKAGQLQTLIEGKPSRSVAAFSGMIRALEAYLAESAPIVGPPPPGMGYEPEAAVVARPVAPPALLKTEVKPEGDADHGP